MSESSPDDARTATMVEEGVGDGLRKAEGANEENPPNASVDPGATRHGGDLVDRHFFERQTINS